MKPLQRKPKTLSEDPEVFALASAGAGLAMQSLGRGVPGRKMTVPPGAAPTTPTDDQAAIVLAPAEQSVDDSVRARARQIAARLALRAPRRGISTHYGPGEFVSARYRGSSDEVDLDATLQVLAENPWPEPEDIIVRERVRTRRSVVLVVDVSGSMKGERINTAAATVGALTSELRGDEVSVIAFWSDVAVLLRMGELLAPQRVLDSLLRLPAQGLTNVGFPLQVAAQQLSRRPAASARVLLLSDCVHNAGPDPRGPAARLPRLDVLLDKSGECDVELGRDLAATGRGQFMSINTHRDVGPALSRIFAG